MCLIKVHNDMCLYNRRMAALEEREAKGHKSPPSHSNHGDRHVAGTKKAHNKNMSQADREIQERLEKLREKTPQESKF